MVILSHMGRGGDSQADWYGTAEALAREGHGALTYNRRGICPRRGDGCSHGYDNLADAWKDVLGAYRRARDEGATGIVLAGASIGAMASLRAAARADVDVAGVIEIGGINDASGYSFSKNDLAAIEGLKVFASSRGDVYGGADAAREWHSWATSPKRLVILEGDLHGTDILRAGGPGATRLTEVILDVAEAAESNSG